MYFKKYQDIVRYAQSGTNCLVKKWDSSWNQYPVVCLLWPIVAIALFVYVFASGNEIDGFCSVCEKDVNLVAM